MLPSQDKKGKLVLEPEYADLHNRIATDLRLEYKGGTPSIGYWTDTRTWISYTFEISAPGTFTLQADVAAEEKSQISIQSGEQPQRKVVLDPSGSYDDFRVVDLGTLTFEEAGTYTLEIRPVKEDWSPVNLRDVTLLPTK